MADTCESIRLLSRAVDFHVVCKETVTTAGLCGRRLRGCAAISRLCNAVLLLPLCPLGLQRWSTVHHTIYSNLSLIKISAELWSLYWCSVLKWSSSSGKNWKPFHLRGLKGSKEHQITLPVVFLFFLSLQKLVTNCTFVGRGLCQAGAGGTALGFRLWRPCQLQNGVCFISPSDPRPKKSHAGKTERYTIHQGLVKLHGWEMRRLQSAEWAESEGAYCRGIFNTTVPVWGCIKVATLWNYRKEVLLFVEIYCCE